MLTRVPKRGPAGPASLWNAVAQLYGITLGSIRVGTALGVRAAASAVRLMQADCARREVHS